jgi:membrane protein required for colicin V production
MIWGAWRGIIWQVASISSLVLGYSVAHPLSGQLAPHFPGEPVVARTLAMLVIYAAVSGGVFLAAWVVRTTLRRLQFEAFDRHLGMVLGGVEGALLGLVATMFVVSLAPQLRDPIFRSPSGRVVGQVMGALGPVLPGEVRSALAPFWNPSEAMAGDAGGETESRPVARPEKAGEPTSGDAELSKLGDLIEKGEARVGKAIADAAEKEFERTGGIDGRAVERR